MSNVPAVQEARAALEKMAPQFKAALPAHIPVERFVRTTLTAVQTNPALLSADRRTLCSGLARASLRGPRQPRSPGDLGAPTPQARNRDGREHHQPSARAKPHALRIIALPTAQTHARLVKIAARRCAGSRRSSPGLTKTSD